MVRSLARLLKLTFIFAAVVMLLRLPALGADRRLLYVAVPGIRNDVQWGGTGILVFDIDQGHKFVRRIPAFPTPSGQQPEPMKGICASVGPGRFCITTPTRLVCIDLYTNAILWSRSYEGGCDRLAVTPNGKLLYVPMLEGAAWHVVDVLSGDAIATIRPDSGSHNTIVGLDGKRAYLAGLKSPLLAIVDTSTQKVIGTAGPFSNVIRPFTVNGRQTLCFVNVNDRLGFEVGDLKTGKVLCRVDVPNFKKGDVKRHGCPSHGIGLTPDEKQLWLSDGFNSRVHVFDVTKMPPVWMDSIAVRDQPGWVTFSLDGRYAYPSTGEVIDVRTRKIVTTLTDEEGRPVQSEKMVEIDFSGDVAVRSGDQFGLGRKR